MMGDQGAFQFTQVKQNFNQRDKITFKLRIRQQPEHSRMCGVGEKADRRPIDPPPIIQLEVHDSTLPGNNRRYFHNPYYFMYTTLVSSDGKEELSILPDRRARTITGSAVSSLSYLKDENGSDGAFFVFPDLSVRCEGVYKLKFILFEIVGSTVYYCESIMSSQFTVYSAKKFPGMEESTPLTKLFAEQGLKIRVRKEQKPSRLKADRSRLINIQSGEDEDGGEGGGPYKKINYGDRHYYHAQDSQKLSVEMERRLRGYHHENNMGRHVDHRIRPYTNTGSYLSKFPEQRGGFSNRQHGVPHPDEGPYSRDSRYQNPHFYVNRRTSAPNSASNHQPKPPYPRIDHSLPNPHDQIPPLPRSDYHQLPPIQVGLKSIPPSSAPVHTDDLSSTKQPYPPDPLLHYSHSERHSPLPKHSSIAHSSKPASASTSAALYSHSPSFKYDSVSTSAPSVRSSQNFSVAIDSEFKQDTSLPQIRVRDNASSSVYRGYKRSSNTPFRPISDLPSYSPVSSSSFDRWNPYNSSLASGTKFVDSAKPKPFDPYISSYQNDPPFDDLAPQYGPPSSTISHSENPIGLSIKLDPAANNSSSRRITVNDLLASDSQANYQSATTQNNDKDRI